MAGMEQATRVVSDLQDKLAHLNQRVAEYQKDVCKEFQRYADSVLRDLPADVTETVLDAVARSMDCYPALNNKDFVEARRSSSTTGLPKPSSLTPETPTAASTPAPHDGTHQSPPEREGELAGFLMPPYLPLLDTSAPVAAAATRGKGPDVEADDSNDTSSRNSPAISPTVQPRRPTPPLPRRRNTDEVSVNSNGSDGTTRRSALRGSSSSSKIHSPRRVRFELEGTEFPTTSSPQFSGPPIQPKVPIILGMDDSDDEDGATQIEDVDDPSPPPPKRISSSQALRKLSRSPLDTSETQWTAVQAPPDGSPSIPIGTASSTGKPVLSEDERDDTDSDPPNTTQVASNNMLGLAPMSSSRSRTPSPLANKGPKPEKRSKFDLQDSDDEETNPPDDMPPLTAMKSKRDYVPVISPKKPLSPIPEPSASPAKPPSLPSRPKQPPRPSTPGKKKPSFSLGSDTEDSDVASSPAAPPRPHIPNMSELKIEDLESEEEPEFFPMDESVPKTQNVRPRRAPSPDDPMPSSLSDTESRTQQKKPASALSSGLSKYATSPAVNINMSGSLNRDNPALKNDALTRPRKGSIVHPFQEPIVSPQVHATAASLGNMNSFVGSLDGRSGVDATDMNSYRASGAGAGSYRTGQGSYRGGGSHRGGSFRGPSSLRDGSDGPRSLSERMMMEEAAKQHGGGEDSDEG